VIQHQKKLIAGIHSEPDKIKDSISNHRILKNIILAGKKKAL